LCYVSYYFFIQGRPTKALRGAEERKTKDIIFGDAGKYQPIDQVPLDFY